MENDRVGRSKPSVIHSGWVSDVLVLWLFDDECDIGTARNGLLIISCTSITNTSDVSDITIFTDKDSGVAITDRKATILKAEYYRADARTTRVPLTVTSNAFTIPCDSSDLVVMVQLADLERYVNVAYKSGSAGTDLYQFEIVLVSYDLDESPFEGARGVY